MNGSPASGYAQTLPQLYGQLRRAGTPLADLCRVRDAYELATQVFSIRLQASGKAFMSHVVGTASILATMRLPSEVVTAGLLHNVYRTGDLGDGTRGPTEGRRALIRRVVGQPVEQYVWRFATLPWRERISTYRKQWRELEPLDLQTLHIRVADLLEHLLQGGALCDDAQERHFVERAPLVAELAVALGHPEIAADIGRELATIASHVPGDAAGGRRAFARVSPPRSYRPRWSVALRRAAVMAWTHLPLPRSITGPAGL